MNILFLMITLFIPAAISAPTPAPSPAPDFIRASCEATLYPDLCYQSLSGYATAVRQDPARLAAAAVAVSLSGAAALSGHLAGLAPAADPRDAAALRDCLEVFGDAVGQIRGSMRQMRLIVAGGGRGRVRFEMSNVQTWMSAALTDEDTCVDGFDDVGDDSAVKMDVCDRTVRVKEVTSNALALVNSYVAKATIY